MSGPLVSAIEAGTFGHAWAFGTGALDAIARFVDVALQSRVDGGTETFLQAYEIVGAALGLFIAYQAYRGYKRNDSRPMFFISLGFALILGIPVVLFAGYLAVPGVSPTALQAVTNSFEILGLLCVIYALRTEP